MFKLMCVIVVLVTLSSSALSQDRHGLRALTHSFPSQLARQCGISAGTTNCHRVSAAGANFTGTPIPYASSPMITTDGAHVRRG
jgi:hypothetical protein